MSYLHVAVAVIVNAETQVLVAQRPDHVHQGGLWEFPGGKVEQDENVVDALKREVREELGIEISALTPLLQVAYDYPDKSVLLDVWRVADYQGQPRGMEGQPVAWQHIHELSLHNFPPANKSIIHSLQLADQYMITGRFRDHGDFKSRLEKSLLNGNKIVQLRAKHVTDVDEYVELANIAYDICSNRQAKLLLNTTVDLYQRCNADGLHLSSGSLFQYATRPVSKDVLLSASCHNELELRQAQALGADMVLLSPVKETASHPGVKGIGWHEFRRLSRLVSCPVYALGGMDCSDIDEAKKSAAQGIAAISSLWPDDE